MTAPMTVPSCIMCAYGAVTAPLYHVYIHAYAAVIALTAVTSYIMRAYGAVTAPLYLVYIHAYGGVTAPTAVSS
jgi:hypothetical protein